MGGLKPPELKPSSSMLWQLRTYRTKSGSQAVTQQSYAKVVQSQGGFSALKQGNFYQAMVDLFDTSWKTHGLRIAARLDIGRARRCPHRCRCGTLPTGEGLDLFLVRAAWNSMIRSGTREAFDGFNIIVFWRWRTRPRTEEAGKLNF